MVENLMKWMTNETVQNSYEKRKYVNKRLQGNCDRLFRWDCLCSLQCDKTVDSTSGTVGLVSGGRHARTHLRHCKNFSLRGSGTPRQMRKIDRGRCLAHDRCTRLFFFTGEILLTELLFACASVRVWWTRVT